MYVLVFANSATAASRYVARAGRGYRANEGIADLPLFLLISSPGN